MNEVVAQRASELYHVCDLECKGYITKSDMKRLVDELPLSQEQLDAVFDSLDDDGNGQLTLQEFTEGFGQFIVGDDGIPEGYREDVEEGSASFKSLKETGIITSDESISFLLSQIRDKDPTVTTEFDSLLEKLSHAVEKHHKSLRKMEMTVRKKTEENEEKVKQLYSDMENKILIEGTKLSFQEKQKEDALREQIEGEINAKEQQYQVAKTKYETDQKKLEELSKLHTLTEKERQELQETRNFLQESLYEVVSILEEKKEKVEELREKIYNDKKQRMTSTASLGKNIAQEQDKLIKELTSLREVNKRLKDEKDEQLLSEVSMEFALAMHKRGPQFGFCGDSGDEEESIEPKVQMTSEALPSGRGSPLGNYFAPADNLANELNFSNESTAQEYEDDIEVDDYAPTEPSYSFTVNLQQLEPLPEVKELCHSEVQTEEAEPPVKKERQGSRRKSKAPVPPPDPVPIQQEIIFGSAVPDSVFKVVILGDVNVGKTSIMQRFIHQHFSEVYRQTVGVDFQMRSMHLVDRRVALQIWDTAGQERFRSITRQFYRKADGVCIVYDVTQPGSYLSVRRWMESIEEAAEEKKPGEPHRVGIILLANKIDLLATEQAGSQASVEAALSTAQGEKMAEEYGVLFHEVSAKTGQNVEEAFVHLATILRQNEEKEMEEAIKLSAGFEKESKGCCLTSK